MRITIDIPEADLEPIAMAVQAGRSSECCPAQCTAIAQETLTRLVCQAAVLHQVTTPAVTAVVSCEYQEYNRTRRLPRARRIAP